jgi:predicted GNAT family N-acyltransferase
MSSERVRDFPKPLRVERFLTTDDKRAQSRAWLSLCHSIRRRVFIDEQGVPEALELDEHDGDSEHFILFAGKGSDAPALGTARLRLIDGHDVVQRVAILHPYRGQNLGRVLMEAVEGRVRSLGQPSIQLSAQLTAVPFYEALGYTPDGDVYIDAGIDHRHMSKRLN